jgi:hypothetical protein
VKGALKQSKHLSPKCKVQQQFSVHLSSGVTNVDADVSKQLVVVEGSASLPDMEAAIQKIGKKYSVIV